MHVFIDLSLGLFVFKKTDPPVGVPRGLSLKFLLSVSVSRIGIFF